MTRSPEIKNKTNRLVFIPLDKDDEKVSSDFKTLCQQDGTTIHDLLYEAIQLCFKVHHWPPGNPQRTLESVTKPLDFVRCKCGKTAVKHGFHLASGVERDFCLKCFSDVTGRYDPKVWRFS